MRFRDTLIAARNILIGFGAALVLVGPLPLVLAQTRPATLSPTRIIGLAGSGTQRYRAMGRLYWENPAVSTTAGSTTWVNSTAFAIPANTLANNGDKLRVELNITWGTAATDTKNVACNIGYSAFSTTTGAFTGGLSVGNASTSNTGAVSQHITGWYTRLSATSTATHEVNQWEGNSTNQSQVWATSAGITWTAANNLLCAVGNTTASNTEVITINELTLFYEPYSTS